MGLKDFFSNSFETNDFEDKDYATHYYISDYNKIKDCISMTAKKLKYDITNVDDQYKELLLVTRTKGELIITVSTLSYYEQGVDIKSTTHHILSCGRAKKRVKEFYEELNKVCTLKRIGGGVHEYK